MQSNLTNSITGIVKDKKLWILLFILVVGAILRLWQIQNLFSLGGDYDQAVYSLDARLLAQGYLPYSDFVLVHPPFYIIVLAAVYKIFGYSFGAGQYLAVVLSLASIIVLYMTGRKFSRPAVGLIAAAFFAVSPDMVYFGRRAVQESLGIFLIVLAIYFLADFLVSEKRYKLFLTGLILGLAVATKYTFLPAVVAAFVATAVLLAGKSLQEEIKKLFKLSFILTYISFVALVIAILLVLVWVFKVNLPVPFVTYTELTGKAFMVVSLVFIMPFILSLFVRRGGIKFKQAWISFTGIFRRPEIYLLVLGVFAGFFAVTGFFWLRTPQQFIDQTLIMQGGRTSNLWFPAFAGTISQFFSGSTFAKMAYLPVLASLPVALFLLNKRKLSPLEFLASFGAIIALFLCQFLMYDTPRYDVSVYPFFLLSLSFLIIRGGGSIFADFKPKLIFIKPALQGMMAVIIIFTGTSIALLSNYGEYDIGNVVPAPDAKNVYNQIDDFLKSVPADKIYAVDPITIALNPELKFTHEFDTYSLLWIVKEDPEKLIEDQIKQGVNYIVVNDGWLLYVGSFNSKMFELNRAVMAHGHMVKTIYSPTMGPTTIYAVGSN